MQCRRILFGLFVALAACGGKTLESAARAASTDSSAPTEHAPAWQRSPAAIKACGRGTLSLARTEDEHGY